MLFRSLSGYEENPTVNGINGLGVHPHHHHGGHRGGGWFGPGYPYYDSPGVIVVNPAAAMSEDERISKIVSQKVKDGIIPNTPQAIRAEIKKELDRSVATKAAMVMGLGMHSSMPSGWTDDRYNASGRDTPWEGGFADRMYAVPFPGIPNDVSETFAPGIPGTAIIAKRIAQVSKLVNSVSDDRVTPRADDPTIPYPQELPIESYRDPVELDYSAWRSRIPMRFNPNAWTGGVDRKSVV